MARINFLWQFGSNNCASQRIAITGLRFVIRPGSCKLLFGTTFKLSAISAALLVILIARPDYTRQAGTVGGQKSQFLPLSSQILPHFYGFVL